MLWLRRMRDSGHAVPDFCRNNPRLGTAHLQEGDSEFAAMAHATLSERTYFVLRLRFHSRILPLVLAGRREAEL
jgi:hypothetical protein